MLVGHHAPVEDMRMVLDLATLVETRRQMLVQEAEHERLLATLRRRQEQSGVRRRLAAACLGLADWLDGSGRDVPTPRTGRAYWAPRSIRL